MVFHYKYDTEDLEKRSKVFGRLSLACALLLILSLVMGVIAQDSNEEVSGWDLQESTVEEDLFDIITIQRSVNDTEMIAVGSQGQVLSSINEGVNWSISATLGDDDLQAIDHYNGITMIAGSGGRVYIQNGNVWDNVSLPQPVDINDIAIANASTPTDTIAYIVGDSGELWKTSDGGISWTNQSSSITQNINGVDFFNQTLGIAVADNGIIISTLDGENWDRREVPEGVGESDLQAIVFKSDIRAYAVGDNGVFLQSSPGANPTIGFGWFLWETGVANQLTGVDATSFTKVWAVGTNGLILNTKDGGNFFTVQNMTSSVNTTDLTSISMADGQTGHIVGNEGVVLFTSTGGEVEDTSAIRDYDNPSVYFDFALPILFEGFLGMLRIIFSSLLLGFVVGVTVALMKTTDVGIIRLLGTIYTDFFRNTPLLVQILFIHFGLIQIGFDLTFGGLIERSVISSTLSLGLNSGAYQAEIIRSGILAIPTGQMEAGRSLGLNYFETMRYIILPQAIRIVIPPLGNEFVNLTLNSSLASLTGLFELVRGGRIIIATTFKTFQTWLLVLLFYFVITYALTNVLRVMERRTKIPGLGLGEVR